MVAERTSFQGVWNVIRFNWHFYAIALCCIITVVIFHQFLPPTLSWVSSLAAFAAAFSLATSLIASYYIYDLSGLYQLNLIRPKVNSTLLSINAGFDEISGILEEKHPEVHIQTCDFYNVDKHTEISIKRARKAYPLNPNSIEISTHKIPFKDQSFELIIAFLSAHEIRDQAERIEFFKELKRLKKSGGRVMVTEHLRDWKNFIAYNIGFFHFHSRQSWLQTFHSADFIVVKEIKQTPFLSTFILE